MTGSPHVLVAGSAREGEAVRMAVERVWSAVAPRWTIAAHIDGQTPADIAIVFMSRWLGHLHDHATDTTLGLIRAELSVLRQSVQEIFLCTIVKSDPAGGAEPRSVRRLNHAAILLSQEFGPGVIDLDRQLGSVGVLNYATDHELTGEYGLEAAAHAIASALHHAGVLSRFDRQAGQTASALLANWRPPVAPQAAARALAYSGSRASLRRRVLRQAMGGFLTWRAVLHTARTLPWREIAARIRR